MTRSTSAAVLTAISEGAPQKMEPQSQGELWAEAGARSQMWKLAVENANDPVLITSANLALPGPFIVYVNRAFCHLSGYGAHEVIGRTPRLLQGPLTNRVEIDRMRRELEAGRSFVGETVNYTKEGQPYHIEWSVYGLHDENQAVSHYVAVQRDISARKRYEAQIEQQAHLLAAANAQLAAANERLAMLSLTDSLTGIANHRALHEKLGEEIARATRYQTPLSLLFLDVDHFKDYNDEFGHPAGDETLQKIAQVLQHHKRQSDILARHGGEEFAVLLPQTDAAGALVVAEALRAAVACTQWPRRAITVSLGAATLADFNGDFSPAQVAIDLMNHADLALYRAKNRGRNCVS